MIAAVFCAFLLAPSVQARYEGAVPFELLLIEPEGTFSQIDGDGHIAGTRTPARLVLRSGEHIDINIPAESAPTERYFQQLGVRITRFLGGPEGDEAFQSLWQERFEPIRMQAEELLGGADAFDEQVGMQVYLALWEKGGKGKVGDILAAFDKAAKGVEMRIKLRRKLDFKKMLPKPQLERLERVFKSDGAW